MKKNNFKAILLLLMVVLLVVSLCACDNKNNHEEPGHVVRELNTPADYFTALWDIAGDIGGESIQTNENLALHFDLALALMLQNGGGTAVHTVDVGLDVSLILDRKTADSRGSALKVRVYDPTGKEDWGTAYFFFNDVENIYLQFAGQNIKVPFAYKNDTLGGSFHKLLTSPLSGSFVLNDAINRIVEGMGSTWSLDNLIDGIIAMTGINLKDAFDKLDADIMTTITTLLGTPLVDDNGTLQLKKILTSNTAGLLFNKKVTTKTTGNKSTYSITVDTGFLGTVVDALSDALNVENLDMVINENTLIKLEFVEVDSTFDHLTLTIAEKGITATNNRVTVSPALSLTVNDISIRQSTGDEIEIVKENFSTDVILDAKVQVGLDGLSINPRALASKANGYDLDVDPVAINNAVLTVGVQGKLDLLNKTDNQTLVNVYVALNNSNLLEASLSGTAGLAFRIDQSVALDGHPLLPLLTKVFGDKAFDFARQQFEKNEDWNQSDLDKFEAGMFVANEDGTYDHSKLNPNFVGAQFKSVKVMDLFEMTMDTILDKINHPNGTAAADGALTSASAGDIIKNVVETISVAMPLFKASDGKLTISCDNIIETAVEIGSKFDPRFSLDFILNKIFNADKSEWMPRFAEFFVVEGFTWDETLTDRENASAFLTLLFTNLKGSITLDMSKNGLSVEGSLKVANAVNISLSLSLSAKPLSSNSLFDVGADVNALGDKTGWVIYG